MFIPAQQKSRKQLASIIDWNCFNDAWLWSISHYGNTGATFCCIDGQIAEEALLDTVNGVLVIQEIK